MTAGRDDAFHATAIFRCHHFNGITFTDSRDGIGIDKASLQQIQVTEKLQSFLGEGVPGQAGRRELFTRKEALKGEIVDSENGFQIRQGLDIFFGRFQVGWNKAGLPVMAVNNIGSEFTRADEFNDSTAEKSETCQVIRIIPPAIMINAIPVVVEIIGHKIDCDAGTREFRPMNPAGTVFIIDSKAQREIDQLGWVSTPVHHEIFWKDDGNLMAALIQGLRE